MYVDIIWEGRKFRLPDKPLEQHMPILGLLHKGIRHIFKPVLKECPGHEIRVTWDEDLKMLQYESPTLSIEKISEILVASHGINFSN